eukprot:751837-Hanusia_phi.AAC.4
MARDMLHVLKIKFSSDVQLEETSRDERISKIAQEEERKRRCYEKAVSGYDRAIRYGESKNHLERLQRDMTAEFEREFTWFEQERERVQREFSIWKTNFENRIRQTETELEEAKRMYVEASNAAEMKSEKSAMIDRALNIAERMEVEYDKTAEVEKYVILNEIEKEMLYHAGLDKFQEARRNKEEREKEKERSLSDKYDAMILRKFGTKSRKELNDLRSQFESLQEGLFKTQCSYDDGHAEEGDEEKMLMMILSNSDGPGRDQDALTAEEVRSEGNLVEVLLAGRADEVFEAEAAEAVRADDTIDEVRRHWLADIRAPLLALVPNLSVDAGGSEHRQEAEDADWGQRELKLHQAQRTKQEMSASCSRRLGAARDAARESRKLIDALLAAGSQLAAHASETLGGGGGDLSAFLDGLADGKRARDLFALAARIGAWRLSESRAGEDACEKMMGQAGGEMERVFGKELTLMSKENAAVLSSETISKFFSERHNRFSSSSDLSVHVRNDVFEMLKLGRSDEEILQDRKLQAAGVLLSREKIAEVREDWNAENEMRREIVNHGSTSDGNEDDGTKGRGAGEEEKARGLGQDFVGGDKQLWTFVAGRWHSVSSRPQRGLFWRPSDFLQVARVDFETIRRSTLYDVVAKVANSKKSSRMANTELLSSPANDNALGSQQAEGLRSDAPTPTPSAATARHVSPWIGTSKSNRNADAPAGAYDTNVDYHKQVNLLPHGDHLNVSHKPRARWNSSSFSEGTAGPMVMSSARGGGKAADRYLQVEENVLKISNGRGARNLPDRRRQVEVNLIHVIKNCLSNFEQGHGQWTLVAMDIDDEACEFLVDAGYLLPPQGPAEAVELHLGSNKIEDRGLLAMSIALWEERSIFRNVCHLDLRSNIISDSSMIVFSHLLAVNNQIVHLNLSDNK